MTLHNCSTCPCSARETAVFKSIEKDVNPLKRMMRPATQKLVLVHISGVPDSRPLDRAGRKHPTLES